MAKNKTTFVCTDCGDTAPQWLGKCPNCGAFNTLKEFKEAKLTENKVMESGIDLIQKQPENKNSDKKIERIKTHINEVDRVLGGGFFPASLILFGGHPGIGKSTLSLQVFMQIPNAFYFSGEESFDQVFSRAKRLNTKNANDLQNRIFSTNSLEDIIETVQRNKPDLIVVDSIQMIGLSGSNFGSTSQIRENAEVLQKLSKSTGTIILIIGHVTKNDELAGPKILEHIVDAVLYLEGEKNSEIRLLRSPKNRFGSAMEIGVFEMWQGGLRELENPSEFFLNEKAENAFGSAIVAIREGARNFLLEIQALTVKTNFASPRRTANGVSLSKFHLLLAVISKFTPFKCEPYDAYLNVIGGFKAQDPAADLAIVAAILSSRAEKEISALTVIFGEVGLSGEVRRVTQIEARIAEAAKLGFKRVICPRIPKGITKPNNIEVIEVKNIGELMKVVLR